MKTTFKHKFDIGDTVYYIDGITVEETVVCGVTFGKYEDRDSYDYGKIRAVLDYRLEGNVYRTEEALFESFEEALKAHNFREYYEDKIKDYEATIAAIKGKIEKCQVELAKLS
jgi:FMN phosphatase YigB (HAD superfamily)